jgi:hypothetical protein
MREFHPACRDNFVVLTVVKNSLRGGIFELSSRQPDQPGVYMCLYGEILQREFLGDLTTGFGNVQN